MALRAAASAAVLLACAVCAAPPPTEINARIVDSLTGRDRLVSNEYAFWNPGAEGIAMSDAWDVTSGSLFVRGGVGYSGDPDRVGTVDRTSSRATGSRVFRMVTRETTTRDTRVSARLRALRYGAVSADSHDWDGIHLWLRYVDETQLYAFSVVRRDGQVTIKRKTPGGPSNRGTYTTLAETRLPVGNGQWRDVTVQARTLAGNSVALDLWIDSTHALSVVDSHSPAALSGAGRVGVRADNVEFELQSLHVADITN